jgi:hypothetical protein
MLTLISGIKSVSMHVSNNLQAAEPIFMKFGIDN